MPKRSLFDQREVYSRSIPRQPGPRVAHPGATYDFGVAYPDPDSLPLTELAEGLRVGLEEEGRELAKYPHPCGYPPLREYVSEKLARDRHLSVSPEDIILGDGSSQPNHMIIEALLNPGEVVLTEEFTYPGTLGILRRFGADIRGVACDREGFRPDALERAIRSAAGEGKRVKLIYTIPTFQNPLGWVMSLERRRHLLETAQRHGIAILEDDCYVDLRFEGEPVPAIASLDTEGVVVYVGSFSKIIGPGVRLGYLAGPSPLLDRISAIKSGGGVSQLGALAIHRYAVSHLEGHVRSTNRILRRKRNAMLAGIGRGIRRAVGYRSLLEPSPGRPVHLADSGSCSRHAGGCRPGASRRHYHLSRPTPVARGKFGSQLRQALFRLRSAPGHSGGDGAPGRNLPAGDRRVGVAVRTSAAAVVMRRSIRSRLSAISSVNNPNPRWSTLRFW